MALGGCLPPAARHPPSVFHAIFCGLMSTKVVQCKLFQAECKLLQEDVNIYRNM